MTDRDVNRWISDRRALIDAATGPEWEVFEYDSSSLGQKTVAVRTIKRSGGNTPVCSTGCSAWPESLPDAALIADARTSLPKALDALEAALAGHEPRNWRPLDGTYLGGKVCNHCRRDWPCATYTAITTALGIKEQS